jgi:hypothetical protein
VYRLIGAVRHDDSLAVWGILTAIVTLLVGAVLTDRPRAE